VGSGVGFGLLFGLKYAPIRSYINI